MMRPTRSTDRSPGRAPGEGPRQTGVGTLAMVLLVPVLLLALSSPWLLLGGVVGLVGLGVLLRRLAGAVREFREYGRTTVALPFGLRVEVTARSA